MEPESHSLPFACGDFESEILYLIGDLEIGRMSRNSLSNEAPCRDPLEVLLSRKVYWGESSIEKPLRPFVLIKEKIEVFQQRREHINRFVRLYR